MLSTDRTCSRISKPILLFDFNGVTTCDLSGVAGIMHVVLYTLYILSIKLTVIKE